MLLDQQATPGVIVVLTSPFKLCIKLLIAVLSATYTADAVCGEAINNLVPTVTSFS